MHQSLSLEANSHSTLVTVFFGARVIITSLIRILSQVNSDFSLPSSLFFIFQFNILQSMPGSSKWLHSFRFYNQTFALISPWSPVCFMLCLPHPACVVIFSLLVTLSLSVQNILLLMLFSNTVNLCFSCNVSDLEKKMVHIIVFLL